MKRWGLFVGLSAFFAVVWFCRPYLSMMPEVCMFKQLTGTGCPGCGLTRSVAATAHLQLGEAVRFHLFGPMILAGAVAVWGCLLFGVRIPWDVRWGTAAIGVIIILFLIYFGIRFSLGAVL
jgi:hypothetical protein